MYIISILCMGISYYLALYFYISTCKYGDNLVVSDLYIHLVKNFGFRQVCNTL